MIVKRKISNYKLRSGAGAVASIIEFAAFSGFVQ